MVASFERLFAIDTIGVMPLPDANTTRFFSSFNVKFPSGAIDLMVSPIFNSLLMKLETSPWGTLFTAIFNSSEGPLQIEYDRRAARPLISTSIARYCPGINLKRLAFSFSIPNVTTLVSLLIF